MRVVSSQFLHRHDSTVRALCIPSDSKQQHNPGYCGTTTNATNPQPRSYVLLVSMDDVDTARSKAVILPSVV